MGVREPSSEPRPWPERLQRRVVWLLLAIALFFVYDIATDIWDGEVNAHLAVEFVVFAICTALLGTEWRRNLRLKGQLDQAAAQSRRLSGEFSEYVGARFKAWNLSRSEQEIAWLLLKGCSFGEVAALRSVQEKTVRQQATSIYAKSGCKSRNEFIAQFIEDLLTSEHQAEARAQNAARADGGPSATSASGRSRE